MLYEDEWLLAIDKPAGIVVHPAPGHWGGTLVNALLHRWRTPGPGFEPRALGIVHRLDKDTSGVLLIAKDDGGASRRSGGSSEAREVEKQLPGASFGGVVRTVDGE